MTLGYSSGTDLSKIMCRSLKANATQSNDTVFWNPSLEGVGDGWFICRCLRCRCVEDDDVLTTGVLGVGVSIRAPPPVDAPPATAPPSMLACSCSCRNPSGGSGSGLSTNIDSLPSTRLSHMASLSFCSTFCTTWCSWMVRNPRQRSLASISRATASRSRDRPLAHTFSGVILSVNVEGAETMLIGVFFPKMVKCDVERWWCFEMQ